MITAFVFVIPRDNSKKPGSHSDPSAEASVSNIGTEPPGSQAPASPLSVAVLPSDHGGYFASGTRFDDPQDRSFLAQFRTPEPGASAGFFERHQLAPTFQRSYKLTFTNTAESLLRITGITTEITKRTPPLDAALLDQVGGAEEPAITVDLDLDEHFPELKQGDQPYFEGHSVSLAPKDSVDFTIKAHVLQYYCEFIFRVTYLNSDGVTGSVDVSDTDPEFNGPFRLSAQLPLARYQELWAAALDDSGYQLAPERGILSPCASIRGMRIVSTGSHAPTCSEAENVLNEYFRRLPTEGQGNRQYVEFQGWLCSSSADSTGCSNDALGENLSLVVPPS